MRDAETVTDRPVVPPRRPLGGITTTGAVATPAVLAVLAVVANLQDTQIYPRLGLPVAATTTQVTVAVLHLGTTLSSAAALGLLLYAVVLLPGSGVGTIGRDGYRAIRAAAWTAGVAGVASLLLALASAADLSGARMGDVLFGPTPLAAFAALEEPMGWFLQGIGFLVVALGCVWALTWRTSALLLVIGVVSLLPPAAVGQAAVGRGHDWATDAGAIQVVAAAVWIGTLIVVMAHRRRLGAVDERTWRRARLALGTAGVAWVASTLVLALLLVIPGSLTGTVWGRWQLVQAGLVAVTTVVWLAAGRRGRLLPAVLGLSGLVVVVAGAMTHSVPPRFLTRVDSDSEVLLGYDLPSPFTAWQALVDWRINILFTLVAVTAVVAYVLGVRTLRRRGDVWGRGRTLAWFGGWLVIVVATSSGVGRYSAGMFSVHMGSHMALNMLGPVLLALGGPVTLALRALRPARADAPSGPREWIVAAVNSPAAKVLTHPFVTLPLFVGSFYVLYFTDLFDSSLRFHWAHQLMNIHFVLVGYLFFWPLVGVDHAPTRLPPLGRLAVLLGAMPFHAFFGIALMSSDTLIGGNFYRSLGLPWLTDLLADQKVGGGIAWATGEVPMLLVIVALLVQWSREDDRDAARHDRREERDDDVELKAYNEMLAQLARGRR